MRGQRREYTHMDESALLALPLDQRVEKCIELGRRDIPVARDEKEEIKDELDKRHQPGLVVYADRPVERVMTHEALAELSRPHPPRPGEVTADHVAAWINEKKVV